MVSGFVTLPFDHSLTESDRSGVFEIRDMKFSMRPNRMMKGSTTTFVKLSEIAVELFYEWLKKIDEVYKR